MQGRSAPKGVGVGGWPEGRKKTGARPWPSVHLTNCFVSRPDVPTYPARAVSQATRGHGWPADLVSTLGSLGRSGLPATPGGAGPLSDDQHSVLPLWGSTPALVNTSSVTVSYAWRTRALCPNRQPSIHLVSGVVGRSPLHHATLSRKRAGISGYPCSPPRPWTMSWVAPRSSSQMDTLGLPYDIMAKGSKRSTVGRRLRPSASPFGGHGRTRLLRLSSSARALGPHP